MTGFRDVVFSPDIEAAPFGKEAAVAGKLVHKIEGSFSEVDRVIDHVCSPFDVVIVRKGPDAEAKFDGRTTDNVVRIGGLTLLRFKDYPGAAKGCH